MVQSHPYLSANSGEILKEKERTKEWETLQSKLNYMVWDIGKIS